MIPPEDVDEFDNAHADKPTEAHQGQTQADEGEYDRGFHGSVVVRVNEGPRLVTLGVEFFFDSRFPLNPIVPAVDVVEFILSVGLEELIIDDFRHDRLLSGQKGAHIGDSEVKQVFR